MSYSILTSFDRGALAQLFNEGFSLREMSEKLGFSKSTIHYELSRVNPYDPVLAQEDADNKRKKCGRKTILTDDLKRIVENHLRMTWSPEDISHFYKVNTSSIYNWINKKMLNFDPSNLPNRNVRKKRKAENRGTFKVNQTIENRPDYINNRSDFGHWEVDTVLSSRGQDKTCLATFVERKSRFFWAIKIPNRTKTSLNIAFDKFMSTFSSAVKSITVDHGKEFSGYEELQSRYTLDVYFCHAYAPWERGTNEWFNRRLRWFFPKKTNFKNVSNESIFEALELINNRPLKVNSYQTAIEVFRNRSK